MSAIALPADALSPDLKGFLVDEDTLHLMMAVLANVEKLSAKAKRAILTNVLNGVVAVDDLWPASEATMTAALQGYGKPNEAKAAWHNAQTLLEPERLWATLQALEASLVVWGTAAYPRLLAEIHNPPAVLFVRGNTGALTGKTLAMVGTRKISDYGHQVVNHLMSGLKQATPGGATIVSGLAAGVDGAAHKAALANHLPTVAVFGCGIDTIFPSGHAGLARDIIAANGALVSEYPPGFPGSQYTYPQRNRIIAGLSYGTVVVEGEQKSGSLITARLALEEDRVVFSVPGSVFNPMANGPHALLRQGAVLAASAEDIVTELGWVTTPEATEQGSLLGGLSAATELSGEDAVLLAHIGYEPTPIETVAQRSGLAMTDLQSRLLMLELDGHIITCPGAAVMRR